jgi:serine/threonine protein kinase
MAAPTTIDQFLELVRRSGLVDSARLTALAPHSAETPKKLAARLVAGGLLTAFQAEQMLLGKWRGFTLGKYKVLERLGYGGNGTVYLCEHAVVRRRVAVKVLPTSKAESPTALTRFYREARAAGALDHAHLVKAHDIDQDNGLHFLVMDFVDGANLQDLVSRCGPLAPARAANYVAQAALGLEAAHAAGLVHRDVKPANILLDRRGVVRVSDLGLARFFCENGDPLTLRFDDHVVLGTADYVSPEQALNSHEVDARADVYSLGATFYFLLTGQPPFPGGKAAQKLIWHQVRQPVPVRRLRPEVPEEMADVVARMLAKDPKQRYQTAGEVVAAVETWASETPAPPTEEEVPLLSPAARGAPGGEADPSSGTLRRTRLASALRPATVANLQLVVHESNSNPGGPATRPTPRPPLRPASMAETPTATSFAADVATKDDSKPPAVVNVAARSPAPATLLDRYNSNRQALRLALILIVGIAVGTMLRLAGGRQGHVPHQATIVVSRAGEPGTYQTLAEALDQAPAGSRIVIRADSWEEALNVPPGPAFVSVEGQAPSGGHVRWRAPEGHPASQPLVKIHGRSGFHLGGVTLDGENRLEKLMVVAGNCPGLTLHDLHLTGFCQTGLTLRSCCGVAGTPCTLTRLRVRPGRSADAALVLESPTDERTAHIEICDCRLEGPYRAALVVKGPTMGLTLARNRVCNADDGVLFRQGELADPLDVALDHNTFYRIDKVAFHFEAAPPPDGRLVLTANLFARTAALVKFGGPDAAGPVVASEGNVCDEASQRGCGAIPATPCIFELSDDAGDDARFLRYPPTSPLLAAGFPGVPPAEQK